MNEQKKQRFWEIDSLRGIAIIMMISYHIIFDINWFHIYPVNLYSLPVLVYLYPISTMFLFLVGVSLTISYSRSQKTLTDREIPIKFLLRGVKIFALGMLITVVTWLYLKEGFVIFGVLHCIGVSIILAYPFLRFRFANLVLGIGAVALGLFLLATVSVGYPWLLWLGLTPYNFYTIDYFPLLPWFGVILVGVFVGNTWYKQGTRQFHLPDFSKNSGVRSLGFLGRHSLIIYLVHQPIIIGLLYLSHVIS